MKKKKAVSYDMVSQYPWASTSAMPPSPLQNDMVDFRSLRSDLAIPLSTEAFRKSSADEDA